MKQKTKEIIELTIHDALANLSALSEMKIDAKEPIGIVKKHKIVIEDEEFSYRTMDWFIGEDAQNLIESIKDTYIVVLEYLKQIYEKDFIDFDEPKCRKGFQAIMVMATDAANKVDEYFKLLEAEKIPNIEKISECLEFKELKSFYVEKISKKFTESLEGEEPWDKKWLENDKSLLLDVEKSGLKDFESLKKDEEYELFYLVDDDEKPFFDHELIRNIKLFCAYDESSLKDIDDDPLLRIRTFLDKDFQRAAIYILEKSQKAIDDYFFQKYHMDSNSEIISLINEAIFAIYLAANPKNLITSSFFKNSIEYFNDFQNFLRDILASDGYQKIIAYDFEDKKAECILEIVHSFCKNLFLRNSSIKQEMIGFIHLLIRKGAEKRKFKYPKKASFLNTILENDESMQVILASYPSGPLMKILDVIRLEEMSYFDPLLQDNAPSKIYEIDHNKNQLDVIRCPSPTKQYIISTAEVTDEFKGFLRSLEKNQKYLFINMQDKNSYKERARCSQIELLEKRADFKNNIAVVGLDKKSDFYHQSGIFINLNKADNFIKIFKNELVSKESAFSIKFTDELYRFVDQAMKFIHKHFFVDKNVLTRKNRLDFIEIFYNFFILKLIEVHNPKVMSFSCKDGIDIGSLAGASFYSFLKLLKNENFTKETEDYFRWLIYGPALLVRERSINSLDLTRTISAINIIDIEMFTHSSKILKGISSLYDPAFLKSIKVINH
ncbi:MAG: hypothetical protein K1060chlam1_00011 [Candidatus Anoxychlamydiales bacterium]|nr:hypothetical protein [Candidatus Anoxychlamydiales bacterium]